MCVSCSKKTRERWTDRQAHHNDLAVLSKTSGGRKVPVSDAMDLKIWHAIGRKVYLDLDLDLDLDLGLDLDLDLDLDLNLNQDLNLNLNLELGRMVRQKRMVWCVSLTCP